MTTRAIRMTAGVLMLAALYVPWASAAPPTIERFDVDRSFVDTELSAACGVTVTTSVVGHVIFRTFPDGGTGPAELTTLNLALTASSGDNTYKFRDVGADLVRIEPDGTAVLQIIGQLPFEFSGVLKIDLETGDVVLEPMHDLGDGTEDACAALTA